MSGYKQQYSRLSKAPYGGELDTRELSWAKVWVKDSLHTIQHANDEERSAYIMVLLLLAKGHRVPIDPKRLGPLLGRNWQYGKRVQKFLRRHFEVTANGWLYSVHLRCNREASNSRKASSMKANEAQHSESKGAVRGGSGEE